MTKRVASLREAIEKSGLQDGMCISFHHHLRGRDYVLNMVLDEIADMGIRNLTVNASSLFDCHMPLAEHIRRGVVTGLETDYISVGIGRELSSGILEKPVIFRTHGTRPSDIASGKCHIDVAFVAAPTSDEMGNCTGKLGPSACGSLGYAMSDAMYADKTVVITDHLVPYPLTQQSITEDYVDYVVKVDSIGNPNGIVSGTTRLPKDPIALRIAGLAARVIEASGLLKEGFSFQTGAGGASLAAASCLKEIMVKRKIQGSFILGGITGYLVDMMECGCFRSILDVQCFDLKAVESIRKNPQHVEISAFHYASPTARSTAAQALDAVVLGATQIDLDFNVNVHTDSDGILMGGSGGHTDVAAGAKLAIIVAPLSRARIPLVTERVDCFSTPGESVDVLVTQYGVAVNPRRRELRERMAQAGLAVYEIGDLMKMGERFNGVPEADTRRKERVIAEVRNRDGSMLDRIYQAVP